MNTAKAMVLLVAVYTIGLFISIGISAVTPTPIPSAQPLVWPPHSGTYQVLIREVHDGDTVRIAWLVEDSGRLFGINAPEVTGEQKVKGLESKEYLSKLLPAGSVATLRAYGKDKYGRALVEFLDSEGKSISTRMVEAKMANEWNGQGVKP